MVHFSLVCGERICTRTVSQTRLLTRWCRAILQLRNVWPQKWTCLCLGAASCFNVGTCSRNGKKKNFRVQGYHFFRWWIRKMHLNSAQAPFRMKLCIVQATTRPPFSLRNLELSLKCCWSLIRNIFGHLDWIFPAGNWSHVVQWGFAWGMFPRWNFCTDENLLLLQSLASRTCNTDMTCIINV